ncbi:MAG TPA: DUF192 domain-containing protein, partial [Candidatus Limnocylindrales bacterium]|nr:DUF192 domain-containing protein [Candidatus Limnocylindrales bacterium]
MTGTGSDPGTTGAAPSTIEPGTGSPSSQRIGGRPLLARNVNREILLATDVESADGLWGKFMGLMGRRSLAPGAALWLPDSNGIHMMFMRFAIDAVFVGKPDTAGARVVLSVHESLPT